MQRGRNQVNDRLRRDTVVTPSVVVPSWNLGLTDDSVSKKQPVGNDLAFQRLTVHLEASEH